MQKTIIALAATLALAGCHTNKQIITDTVASTPPPSVETEIALQTRLSALAAGQLGWNTMQAGGSVKFDGGKVFSSAMQMRMIRNQSIYISLRPMLGIEVAKIVITTDSLLVVDKYHKRYIAEPLSLITNGIPVTVSTMQDIFLGRSFVLGSGSVSSSTKQLARLAPQGAHYRLTPAEQPREFHYGFDYDGNNRILMLEVTPTRGKQTPYKATYSDVQTTLAGNIAHHTEVSATVGSNSLKIIIDLKNVTWNTSLSIEASKPENYKRMDGHQITSILEGN